ncbi:MAG TPA: LamB/YcsF family protein, partial [Pricia sp.]|nr:LamB/YcsF family protein [Pricia sp.]
SPEAVLEHILHMVKRQKVRSIDNQEVKILADTFCIHSDTPSTFEIVSYLSQELPIHNIQIKK